MPKKLSQLLLKAVSLHLIRKMRWGLCLVWPLPAVAAMYFVPVAGDRSSLYLAPGNTPVYIQNISETYRQRIEDFIAVARRAEALELVAMMSDMSKSTLGHQQLETLLRHDVIPFFADHDHLDSASAYNPAGSSSSISGYWFDLYSVTRDGSKRPFSIVVVREKDGYAVANIRVNACRANRHPFCPSGYAYR